MTPFVMVKRCILASHSTGIPLRCMFNMDEDLIVRHSIALWSVHLTLGILTAVKWRLLALDLPVVNIVTRDSAMALTFICGKPLLVLPDQIMLSDSKPIHSIVRRNFATCNVVANIESRSDLYVAYISVVYRGMHYSALFRVYIHFSSFKPWISAAE